MNEWFSITYGKQSAYDQANTNLGESDSAKSHISLQMFS